MRFNMTLVFIIQSGLVLWYDRIWSCSSIMLLRCMCTTVIDRPQRAVSCQYRDGTSLLRRSLATASASLTNRVRAGYGRRLYTPWNRLSPSRMQVEQEGGGNQEETGVVSRRPRRRYGFRRGKWIFRLVFTAATFVCSSAEITVLVQVNFD